MIRPVVDLSNSTDFIISVPEVISENAFLGRAAARPNSYAWRLASNVYKDIFVKSLDIKRDFELYYKVEYADFAEYLRKRHLLRRDEAAEIAMAYSKSAAIFRYKRPYSFLESSPGETMLRKLLDIEVNR
jgi:hypothetical protein